MLSVPLWIFGISAAAFVVVALITGIEERRGSRFVFARVRAWLDQMLSLLSRRLLYTGTYITKYVITLSWYYGLHAFLKAILQFLAYIYTRIENMLIRNRARAKQIRRERRTSPPSHLTAIAEHKVETALTSAQQKKLRDKTLAGTS